MSDCKEHRGMFILYVSDQERSKNFYAEILECDPILHVPGMTEFKLLDGMSLGIMPEEGIARILGGGVPNPSEGNGVPRCEIYLFVDDPDVSYKRLIALGGQGISGSELKPWGDYVSYGMDFDGHIIAFAKKK